MKAAKAMGFKIAAGVLGLTLGAAAAQATTITTEQTYGLLAPGDSVDDSTEKTTTGAFADAYTFSVGDTQSTTGETVYFNGIKTDEIQDLELSLYSGGDPNGLDDGGAIGTLISTVTGGSDLTLSWTLAAGSYFFLVNGNVVALGSDNSSEYLFSISTVPLPAAAWLFGSALAGLVAIGRRRQLVAQGPASV